MTTIESLIANEVEYQLEHKPTSTELADVMKWLERREQKTLDDVENDIAGWRKLHTAECDWCGERYLPEEMLEVTSGQRFCSAQCKRDYKDEHGLVE